MGTLILNFLQEQGILIMLGLMLAGGLFNQIVNAKRYRRLRGALRAMAGTQNGQSVTGKEGAAPVPVIQSQPLRKKKRQAPEEDPEMDAQIAYLKQSLDRIAAGRDQKLEEEVRERRKLTPEQEEVIADILKEYLS